MKEIFEADLKGTEFSTNQLAFPLHFFLKETRVPDPVNGKKKWVCVQYLLTVYHNVINVASLQLQWYGTEQRVTVPQDNKL